MVKMLKRVPKSTDMVKTLAVNEDFMEGVYRVWKTCERYRKEIGEERERGKRG